MGAAPDHTLRVLALHFETRDAIRLIERGLGELQLIDMGNDFYHPAFLLLSSGLERLMKCIICFRALERDGTFPSRRELKKHRHNLEDLLEEVMERCSKRENGRPPVEADAAYLESDKNLRRIVRILSRFGESARYHNLDVIAGGDPRTESPDDEWAQIESEIVLERPDLLEALSTPTAPVYGAINRELVGRIERAVRALCRIFTLGPLGKEGGATTAVIIPFLFMSDEEIGERDYRPVARDGDAPSTQA
jgi:hypothetical protein